MGSRRSREVDAELQKLEAEVVALEARPSGLRIQLEALLRDFPARTFDGFWPWGASNDYKNGAIEAEAFWVSQIRRALDATERRG